MQEPGTQPPQDPHEEIETLRQELRRLETEHAEVQQKLFDHYEWTREKTKAFGKELQSLRRISLEYKLFDFVSRIYERTTGLPPQTIDEEIVRVKIFLVAIPTSNDPHLVEWLRSLLSQSHANFELAIVQGKSDPVVPQDIAEAANVRIVRTEDYYPTGVRANIGLGYASGDVYGFVISGCWPYRGTLENIARCFRGSRNCQVLAPLDFSVWQDLIVPTEDAGQEAFTQVWQNYASRCASLFFRRSAYEKLGRIIYEAGDSWIYGTLFHLARHFAISRPNALTFVNAIAEGPEIRAQRESLNRYVSWRFYDRLVLEDSDKRFWPLPIFASKRRLQYQETLRSAFLAGSNLALLELPPGLRYQQKIEQRFLQVRSWILRLRQKLFPARSRLHFRVDPRDHLFGSHEKIDLNEVKCCPLSERLPDRFLFSLHPISETEPADVYYSSGTSVAVISRRGRSLSWQGLCMECQAETGVISAAKESPPLASRAEENSVSLQGNWRFIRPAALERGVVVIKQRSNAQSIVDNGTEAFLAAYEAAIAPVLDEEKFVDALWIGEGPFSPIANSAITYAEVRLWNEYPALTSVDFDALRESKVLAGRNIEDGFDLIHLAGVLQLCRRPRHLLRFLAFALKFNAPILISTPNLDSSDLRFLGPAWCHWDPQRTCFVYGAQSLRALMRHCGFEETILVSFSHSSWRAASRRNLSNAIPPVDVSTGGSFVEGVPALPKSKNQPASANLEGDFLIGLFNRKL